MSTDAEYVGLGMVRIAPVAVYDGKLDTGSVIDAVACPLVVCSVAGGHCQLPVLMLYDDAAPVCQAWKLPDHDVEELEMVREDASLWHACAATSLMLVGIHPCCRPSL